MLHRSFKYVLMRKIPPDCAVASESAGCDSTPKYEKELELGTVVWEYARSLSTNADPSDLSGALSYSMFVYIFDLIP